MHHYTMKGTFEPIDLERYSSSDLSFISTQRKDCVTVSYVQQRMCSRLQSGASVAFINVLSVLFSMHSPSQQHNIC